MCRSSTCCADGTLPDPVVAVKVPVTAVNEPPYGVHDSEVNCDEPDGTPLMMFFEEKYR